MKADKKRLLMAMAEKCMDLRDLAAKAEMPYPSAKNVVNGRSVRPSTLGRIAKALEVPVIDILADE